MVRLILEYNATHTVELNKSIDNLKNRGIVKEIARDDALNMVRDELLQLKLAFDTLINNGIDEEIMLTYLKGKGIPAQQAKAVLKHQKEFFAGIKILSK